MSCGWWFLWLLRGWRLVVGESNWERERKMGLQPTVFFSLVYNNFAHNLVVLFIFRPLHTPVDSALTKLG
uniref:Secreted protein n=1 Tax=Populus trichocarpa TaxID=3694 RepID=A0A2K2C233_POPTR